MRVLIVADVHANIEAFQSVIEDARRSGGFQQIWHLGDIVGYGPDPAACIDLLRQYDHLSVTGNHDLGAIGSLGLGEFNLYAAAALQWTMSVLTDDHLAFLRQIPHRREAKGFTMVHGSPRDTAWEYLANEERALANFQESGFDKCLVGHTHIPRAFRYAGGRAEAVEFPADIPLPVGNGRLIINPGSVGQPRDGIPMASYAILDSAESAVTRHRVDYDIPATQAKMRANRLPRALIDRLDRGH